MTREEALKNLENQIDYFTYELKRSIVNSAITGHQSSNVWDKFKGFMQNLYHGKNNPKNPNFTKSVLGHGLGKQANENKHVPLKNYRFFKEWHETLEHSLNLINEDYKTPELPSHIKNTQLNKIIDDWSVKFKRAILSTIELVLGTASPTGYTKEPAVSGDEFDTSAGGGQFGRNNPVTPVKPVTPVDPNTGSGSGSAGDPTATGGDPTATGGDPTATGGDPTATGGDPNAGGGDPNAVSDPSAGGGDPNAVSDPSADKEKLEKAIETYKGLHNTTGKGKFNSLGGGTMPIFATTEIKINKFGLKIRIPTDSIPYVLRYGNPVIDILRYGNKEKYNYFLKLGRIETKENEFVDTISDDVKKQIIKKAAEYKLSEKTYNPTYKKNIENILNNANNVELNEFIKSLEGFSSTGSRKGRSNTSEPTNTPEPVNKNEIKLETKEFLQKALNLQDDDKFSVYINKNNQNLRNYLENIFNNKKQEFVEEIKKNISLPEEEKVQIEKLNELDLDQFIEGFVRIMGIAFVYKIISPLSTSSDEEVSKILKLDKKKLVTILRILNEDYIINYFIKLSIDKIKELSELSEEHNPWGEIEKYKNHTIEQLKNNLEKIDNIEKLLDEIKKILVRIASIPTRS